MKLCFATDLHGRYSLYKQLLILILEEQPEALILGGDQCPLSFGPTAEIDQRTWLDTIFRDFLNAVAPICPVYWNSGNHDLAAVRDTLETFERAGLIFLCDMQYHDLGHHLQIVGFPYGRMSGWPFADWAMLDQGQILEDWQESVRVTAKGGLEEVDATRFLARRPNLAQKLAELTLEDTSRCILICHYPPFSSGLDLAASEQYIGSHALTSHLRHHAYPLSLHGHVHEAPYLCGYWASRAGKSIMVNPGQWGNRLHAIFFEWPNLAETLKHTLFGRSFRVESEHDAVSMRNELQAKWNSVIP